MKNEDSITFNRLFAIASMILQEQHEQVVRVD